MGISVSDYLILRLQELGVEEFFGLPGDYNFNIIEAIEKNKNTNWIGCTNELNAGYAADGYARIKGCGAVVTTFGVGELSAINAIAGAASEFVPVVKITGTPATKYIKENKLIHHNLNMPDYFAFEHAYSHVVETTAFLNFDNAKDEIDRVLSVLIKVKKPVYIAIPADVCNFEIEDEPNIKMPASNKINLELALKEALKLMNNSKNPAIMADVMVKRFNAKDELQEFLKNSNYPSCALIMGKDLISGDCNYSGIYVGSRDNPEAYSLINNSDCPIFLGTVMSDLNTQGFDIAHIPSNSINIQGTYTVIKNKVYNNVLMKDILGALAKTVKHKDCTQIKNTFELKRTKTADDEKLSADYIYPRIEDFLQEGDNLVCETGLINFALPQMKLPKNVSVNNQILWGSIGWGTGAALGISMADKKGRTVLITGEGSHQLSAQEISTIMRHGLNTVIIVLNNDGYTIERLLSKDPMDKFNDIARWRYSKLPEVFEGEAFCANVETNKKFSEALNLAQEKYKDRMCYIEAHINMFDMPSLASKVLNNLNLQKI